MRRGVGIVSDDELTVRSRRVLADPSAFLGLSAGGPASVRLNLFPDVVAESVIEWSRLTANGYSWAGGGFGSAAMAVNGRVVRSAVRAAGREYEIRGTGLGSGVLEIREVDRSGLRLHPSASAPAGVDRPFPAPARVHADGFHDSGERVDLAVFLTYCLEILPAQGRLAQSHGRHSPARRLRADGSPFLMTSCCLIIAGSIGLIFLGYFTTIARIAAIKEALGSVTAGEPAARSDFDIYLRENDYPIARIRTGQFTPEGDQIWMAEFPAGAVEGEQPPSTEPD